jgi:hypothetical protein
MNRRTRTIVDTLLPSGRPPAYGGDAPDAGFEPFLDEFYRTAPVRLRQGFRVGIATATWFAPILIGRVPPLSMHGRETRERALKAMARRYLLRQLLSLLKTVVSFWYGADPEVRAAMGYPPPVRPA